jgi:hypothetical protein
MRILGFYCKFEKVAKILKQKNWNKNQLVVQASNQDIKGFY